jgi:hypothetical protein
MNDIPNDRESVARIHGAVALTATARGLHRVRITMSPPRTMPMAFVVAEAPADETSDDVISRIMLELASGEALRMLNGVEPGIPAGATTLLERLAAVHGDEREPAVVLQECRAKVARLLNANRGLVEMLGSVLFREGSLQGADVQRMIGDSLSNPD